MRGRVKVIRTSGPKPTGLGRSLTLQATVYRHFVNTAAIYDAIDFAYPGPASGSGGDILAVFVLSK